MVDATIGNAGFDISKLLGQTGLTTLDNGFGNTAACKSAITYIDGDRASCATAATRSSSSPSAAPSSSRRTC